MLFLVSLGLFCVSAFEFEAGTTFDSTCVQSMCTSELEACEADRGDLSDNRSHCRTLLFCLAQIEKSTELGVKNMNSCTAGLTLADLTPAAAKLTSCVKDNNCINGGIVDDNRSNPPTNNADATNPIIKSFDVACIRRTCPTQLAACNSSPECKSMSECLSIKNGDIKALAQCPTSEFNLNPVKNAFFECGTENKCIEVTSAVPIRAHGSASSFFQVAQQKSSETVSAEPWRQIQEETKLRLKQLHEKLFKTNERVQQNLKLEKENLDKIKAFESSQKAKLAESEAELEKSMTKLKVKPSFVEVDAAEDNADSVFDRQFVDAMTDIKEFAQFDKIRDEDSPASFLETIPSSFEAEANAKIDEVLQRGRSQADASAQKLTDITAQLRRKMQAAKPLVSLIETNDEYSSKARQKLNDLKKILAQQSNLLSQLGKVGK